MLPLSPQHMSRCHHHHHRPSCPARARHHRRHSSRSSNTVMLATTVGSPFLQPCSCPALATTVAVCVYITSSDLIYNILKKIEYPPYIGEEDRCEAMFHEDPSWSTSSSMDDLLMFDVRSTIHSSSYEFFQTCLCCSSAVDGGAQPSASSFRLKRRKMAANDDKIFQIPKHFSQHQDMAVRLQCLHPSSAGVAVGWVAENQENSQKNRRKLAESTRDFKKAQPEEKLNLFSSLLKSYQEEVDNLTKRAKFGENAFLNIYQKLYEAPDPYPALASIGEQDLKLSELESENRKMKVELEEFRTEATHLKNQQATIRRLEERNRQLEQQAVGYNSIEAEDWEVATSGEG
ncbi:protein CASP [Cucumis melo var. makuwa]|uniref:Protein CASP n=1 Tax=Cucumis melo var. makuwa TaxID=1194695 RepID=A0A5A7V499_CUCMM|nr:protein CASP [Cucumis melo var. makuwa]